MATGCSCLDMISNFLFSLETKPQILGHILGYYVHICHFYFFFPEPQSLLNDLIHITSCKPKTMGCFFLSSTDNVVSLTQIHQGIRCQGALSMDEDIWIQDIYSASEEVQWEQEIGLSYPLHFAAQKNPLRIPQNVSQNWLSLLCYLLKNRENVYIKVPRIQCFKNINPSREGPKLWFQHHFLCWIKPCGSDCRAKPCQSCLSLSLLSTGSKEQSPNPTACPRPSWLHSDWKMREVKLSELVADPEGWDKQPLPLLMMVNPCDVLITEQQCPHRAA